MSETQPLAFEGITLEPNQPPVMPEPEPDDGKAPCPECGERYIIGAGMTRHRKTKHGVKPPGGKAGKKIISCDQPGCNGTFQKDGLGRHMRNVHGIYGGVSGKPRPGGTGKNHHSAKRGPDQPKLGRPKKVLPGPVEMEPPTAEEVVRTVTEMIWPDQVPTFHMGALLVWYMQTADFLRAVNGLEG